MPPTICQVQEVENEEKHSQLLVFKPISDFLRDPPEIPETDLASVVVIEELECPANFLHRVACEDPLAHWRVGQSEGTAIGEEMREGSHQSMQRDKTLRFLEKQRQNTH